MERRYKSMVRVTGIKRTGATIEADYFPENEKEAGHIILDRKSGEVVEVKQTKMDMGIHTYAAHAASLLRKILKDEEIPPVMSSVWY